MIYQEAERDFEIFWGAGYEEEITWEGLVLPRPKIVGIEYFHKGVGFDLETLVLIGTLKQGELVDLSDLSGTCIVRRLI